MNVSTKKRRDEFPDGHKIATSTPVSQFDKTGDDLMSEHLTFEIEDHPSELS